MQCVSIITPESSHCNTATSSLAHNRKSKIKHILLAQINRPEQMGVRPMILLTHKKRCQSQYFTVQWAGDGLHTLNCHSGIL
ncbi:hypothetical protein XENTR_v10002604 [Xenopus tropicalis]|nr:hypothetical protein XENTR_v10002604 [Xenopus tropicalis]